MSQNNNIQIFKKEIVKDILLCFEKVNKPQLRFSEIKKGLPDKKYFDTQISRALNEMLSFGIFNKIDIYYQLTDKYSVEVRRAQLSRMVDAYPPEDVMDFSKTVLLGLPSEIYRPSKYEISSEYFHDLDITPKDIFEDNSDFTKRVKERMKEMEIKSIDEQYENKTKDEVLEALKRNVLGQIDRELSFKPNIPPYEACERIIRKLVAGRDKYRLLLIQQEYELQLPLLTDSSFKQYMRDYQGYFTHKLNLYFTHFFKTGRHSGKDIYEDFGDKHDFESTLHLFYNTDDDKLPMNMARPSPESVVKWGAKILKFLSIVMQNVNEQTNDRYVTPITIVSTSFRAVFAPNEFLEADKKIRKIIR